MPTGTTDNSPLAPGYIWVQIEDVTAMHMPPGYLVNRMGGVGYYSRLDPSLPNGHLIIKVSEYPCQSV